MVPSSPSRTALALALAAAAASPVLVGCSPAAPVEDAEQGRLSLGLALPAAPDDHGAVSDAAAVRRALAAAGAKPCDAHPDFLCATVPVPLEHGKPKGKTLDLAVAVRPATGERQGAWVVFVGGPGEAGVAEADGFGSVDPRIPAQFDVVYFNLRGVGGAHALECPKAVARQAEGSARADTPAEAEGLIARSRRFAAECTAEFPVPLEDLAHYNSAEAVEDVESLRRFLGDGKLSIYGYSYGSQLAQGYATAHKDRVSRLVLDGTVDLTRGLVSFDADLVRAADAVLERAFALCQADASCARDFDGTTPAAAYDRVAARLARGPMTFRYPLAGGPSAPRRFTLSDLDLTATSAVSSPAGRMRLLRAIAAADREGDAVPLARALYAVTSQDPETLSVGPSGFSLGVFHTFICNDYGRGGPTEAAALDAYMKVGEGLKAKGARLLSSFYDDLPCIFWPTAKSVVPRPGPFTDPGLPTLLVEATADTLVPYDQGATVLKGLPAAFLVRTEGGQHVMYGRGLACTDQRVSDFIVKGKAPPSTVTTCQGTYVSPYVAIAPASVATMGDVLGGVLGLDGELNQLPDYQAWGGAPALVVGCDRGGKATYTIAASGDTTLQLDGCSFTEGLSATGTLTASANADRTEGRLELGGAHAGSVSYARKGGVATLKGTYDGAAVSLTR